MSSPMEIEETEPVAAPIVANSDVRPILTKPKKEQVDKSKKNEADYTQRLLAKYFSDKDIYGDKIFKETSVNGGTIFSSRYPGTHSYANPVQAFMERKVKVEANHVEALMERKVKKEEAHPEEAKPVVGLMQIKVKEEEANPEEANLVEAFTEMKVKEEANPEEANPEEANPVEAFMERMVKEEGRS